MLTLDRLITTMRLDWGSGSMASEVHQGRAGKAGSGGNAG